MAKPISYAAEASCDIAEHFTATVIAELATAYFAAPSAQRTFFVVHKSGSGIVYHRLGDVIDKQPAAAKDFFADRNIDEIYFCFSDPSCSTTAAGWPARNFLAMLAYFWWASFKMYV